MGIIMANKKLSSGSRLPEFILPLVSGGEVVLGKPQSEGNWQLVFIYRGLHCPLCNQYLKKLEGLKDKFLAAGVEVVALSGDPKEKAVTMVESNGLSFPVAFGLSIEQMQDLGLYISHPRSPEETDRPFPEPGMFAVNAEGKVQLIDISNTPFNRSNLDELPETVEWIRENDYPIRGTYE
jgi:peroxiredoxin